MENLTDAQAAGVVGVLAAMGAAAVVIGLIVYVLYIIANWKIFTKAGEKGWKSIIPVYNVYILFKITWKTSWFWIMLALSVLSGILTSINPDNSVLMTIGGIVCFAALIITIIQTFKTSRAFDHGFPFFLGLLFLNTIFTFILAFGSSRYVGPQSGFKNEN